MILLSLLLIGDSLTCGSFGKHLFEDLNAKGYSVALYCAVSSAPANWVDGVNPEHEICQTRTTEHPDLVPCGGTGQTPKLATILKAYPNARRIVALGTNSLYSAHADESYSAMAKAVFGSGTNGKCDWIGPPHLRPDQSAGYYPPGQVAHEENSLPAFYSSLAKAVEGDCETIDSRPATALGTPGDDTKDGIHRTDAAGKYWADQIVNEL